MHLHAMAAPLSTERYWAGARGSGSRRKRSATNNALSAITSAVTNSGRYPTLSTIVPAMNGAISEITAVTVFESPTYSGR